MARRRRSKSRSSRRVKSRRTRSVSPGRSSIGARM